MISYHQSYSSKNMHITLQLIRSCQLNDRLEQKAVDKVIYCQLNVNQNCVISSYIGNVRITWGKIVFFYSIHRSGGNWRVPSYHALHVKTFKGSETVIFVLEY